MALDAAAVATDKADAERPAAVEGKGFEGDDNPAVATSEEIEFWH